MMRILYVSTEQLNKAGGTPLRIREIVTQWVRQGHEVTVLSPRYGKGSPGGWPVPLEFVQLPGRNVGTFALFDLTLGVTVPRAARRHRADVVLSTGSISSALVHRRLRALGIPYAVELNGIADVEASRMAGPRALRTAFGWLMKHSGVYRHADLFICVAPGIQQELASRWPPFAERSVVIGNGVDVHRFLPADRNECRKRLGLKGEAFVFGFVGLLCPWHGTEDLITATRILRDRGRSGFQTIIVGGGQCFDSLREQATREQLGDLVLFTGRIRPEQVPEYTASFDVACQVHNDPEVGRFGNSMKFWEYLASGLPVIVSDMSEASRHVGAGVAGWVFRGGQPEALADRMSAALDVRERLGEMGRENRSFAVNGHRWEDVALQMASSLGKLAG